MGIFKDLGFSNKSGTIVSPDSKLFDGYTLDQVKAQIKPTFVHIDNSIDAQAIIQGSSLPTTLSKDTTWTEFQPIAYNFQDSTLSNDVNTKLFLHGSLSDQTGKAVTVVGNTTLSSSQIKNNAKSIYFDGSGDYLTFSNSTDFDFGIGDFTIELNFNFSTINTGYRHFLINSGKGAIGGSVYCSWGICYYNNNISFYRYDQSGYVEPLFPFTIQTGKWYHLALVRNTNKLSLYIDGVLIGFSSLSNNIIAINSDPLYIGYAYTGQGNLYFNGYMDDIRISNIARYTANFTPAPYYSSKKLIINNNEQKIQSNSSITRSTTSKLNIFGDSSCKAVYTFDSSNASDLSGIYNGSVSNVTYSAGKFGNAINFLANNTDKVQMNSTILGNTDYSISVWYKVSSKIWSTLFTTTNIGWAGTGIMFTTDMVNVAFSHANGANTNNGYALTPILSDGLWHHYVAVRNGTSIKLYEDGILKSSATLASNVYTHSYNAYFGGFNDGYAGRTPGIKSIDQVRVFNRALTQAEVTTLFNETETVAKTTFEKSVTTDSQLKIDLEGTMDSLELNFYTGV